MDFIIEASIQDLNAIAWGWVVSLIRLYGGRGSLNSEITPVSRMDRGDSMNTVYVESTLNDDARRQRLYQGQMFVFGPRPSTEALIDHARAMIEEAFAPLDPISAQFDMPVERFVEICGPLKPAFIHHPRTKDLIGEVVSALGADLEATYLDVPRLRMVTSDGYLTAGVGYAHPPHRDTWYSAPMCQLNWWLPIYEMESESSVAFLPRYWNRGIRNGSEEFNYYEWNGNGRAQAAGQIHADTRNQPNPQEPVEMDGEIRFVVPAGGIVLFSGSQLHATVENTTGKTRYSIDFRTVNRSDLEANRAAPIVDSFPQGTSLRDFKRGTDRRPLPDELIAMYDDAVPAEGVLVYTPGN